ncbi:hypothetical protein N0V88_007188 [Collariella sp. IMI 366227]|nr:hypothetical protein N0V88_007188 [Collariella sp. IMI 366227]
MAIPCMSYFGRLDSTYGTLLTDGMTNGLLMHEAWKVSWAAFDISTLSLSLPALTSGWTLSKWTPGETVIRVTPESTSHETDRALSKLVTKYQERLGLKTPIELETPAVELEKRERREGGLPT